MNPVIGNSTGAVSGPRPGLVVFGQQQAIPTDGGNAAACEAEDQ